MVDLLRNKKSLGVLARKYQSSIMEPLVPARKTDGGVTIIYKTTFRKSPVDSRANNSVPGNSLNVDKLHMIKIMNRESESAGKERFFSKYSPLPNIETVAKGRRGLVREKTYRVLDPVFVRGPEDIPRRMESSRETSKVPLPSESTSLKDRRPPLKGRSLPKPRSLRDHPLSLPNGNTKPVTTEMRKFCPERIEVKGPGNNVFWFPV